MAYDLLEPFGQRRADDGTRLLATLLFNPNRGDGQPLAPNDFLKVWTDPAAAEAAQLANLKSWMNSAVYAGTSVE